MSDNHISFINDATELRKLVLENPTLPIVVMTYGEVCQAESYYWLSHRVTAKVGAILDTEVPWEDEKTYNDKDDFREDLEEWLWTEMGDSDSEIEPDETEFEDAVEEKMKQYEPYWKECIIVYCDN